ncbi:uncharacterized protein LOC124294237 [Neodiprion lecontei]|uniref:Uncharacterized protein LOC124294237 n=1 Tax=Neodiprion lecontei TaxID=441921 RepID=A0ABM3G422_NEOLC|nr:uncharacterized protein LOC124294237 [Neodiprion lecontei]
MVEKNENFQPDTNSTLYLLRGQKTAFLRAMKLKDNIGAFTSEMKPPFGTCRSFTRDSFCPHAVQTGGPASFEACWIPSDVNRGGEWVKISLVAQVLHRWHPLKSNSVSGVDLRQSVKFE